jgi:polyisoprenoid-binding protein YceI
VSESSPGTRLVAGVTVPAVGVWAIDPCHSFVGFSSRRLGIAFVRGRFRSVSGRVHVAEHPSESWVEAVIGTASVDSGSAERDERLRSAEHLDVARHPTAAFRSTRVRWNGSRGVVTGELTLVGATNAIDVNFAYRGTVVDPWGAQRSVFAGEAVIDREDWGLTWNVTLEGGGQFIGPQLRLDLEVETVGPEPLVE